MMTVIRTDPCGPAESGINTVRAYRMSEEGMTAPEGAGFLEGITLRHPLRDVYDDHTVVGDDRHAETVVAAFGDDHEDPLTSCRDGSESAGKVRCHDRFGASRSPAFLRNLRIGHRSIVRNQRVS